MADISWLTSTVLGFLFLTFNSGMAVYRSNGDTGSIIFVVVSYVDLVALLIIFCRVLLLVLNAAAIPLLHRRLLPPLRYDAAILSVVFGASSLFHAVAAGPNDDMHALAAAGGFLIWLAGVAELLLLLALTPGLF